jgi:hypothetical protein
MCSKSQGFCDLNGTAEPSFCWGKMLHAMGVVYVIEARARDGVWCGFSVAAVARDRQLTALRLREARRHLAAIINKHGGRDIATGREQP